MKLINNGKVKERRTQVRIKGNNLYPETRNQLKVYTNMMLGGIEKKKKRKEKKEKKE